MLSLSDISKSHSGQTLYEGGSFQIKPGEKVGLVGPNGAGKTTIFRLIIGEEKADTGSISMPQGWRIAYFSQNVGEMKGRTAIEEVMAGDLELARIKSELDSLQEQLDNAYADPDNTPDDDWLAGILEKLGDAQTEFEKRGGFDMESRAQEVLTGLAIGPDRYNEKVESFSGGWKMRIALAKVLIMKPDLILMDEPTNYLDLETIVWLENWLKAFTGAILMTSHDRWFMNAIVNKIVEIRHGNITTYSGNYDFYEKERNIRREQLEAQKDRQDAMLKKEEEFIAKFAARASHAAQVQSRVKKLDKIERVELAPEELAIQFEFPQAPRGGNDVVSIENLAKTWVRDNGAENKVFSGLSATVRRLEKIAVVGVNGAGKSTLLKIMIGDVDPTAGKVKIGEGTRLGYFGQFTLDCLKPENTVWDEVKNYVPMMSDGAVRSLLAAFLFRGDDIEKKVKYLSGGEKARLILAGILATPKNLLVLDEPTNHLDIRSREILLDALKAYDGTVLLVSHDRHFLKELCNKVWEVDRGVIQQYPGTYKEWSAR
ncbi:MAG: ATP-binding cassette domain-containing protein [Proteobacteria bacterium]|jgi:ATP-binding cassette subfamily F protein 3|nr:ATP-binding cassette domain-containing protein [Pseudomonadota bacterium]